MTTEVLTSMRVAAPSGAGAASVAALLPERLQGAVGECDRVAHPPATHPHPLAARVPLWDAHVQRLVDATHTMHRVDPAAWPTVLTADDVLASRAVADVWAAAQNGPPLLRASLRAGPHGELRAITAPLGAPAAAPPRVRLDTHETRLDGPLTCTKTTARAAYDEARARVGGTLGGSGACFDVLLWHADGGERVVTESSIANLVVAAPDGRLYTPAFGRLLPGLLVQELRRRGLVAERRITAADLAAWAPTHTFYLCNAVRGMFEVSLQLS